MKIQKEHRDPIDIIVKVGEPSDVCTITDITRGFKKPIKWFIPINILREGVEKSIVFLQALPENEFYYKSITIDIDVEPRRVIEICKVLASYKSEHKFTRLSLSEECYKMLIATCYNEISELDKNFDIKEVKKLNRMSEVLLEISKSKLSDLEIRIYFYLLGMVLNNQSKKGGLYIPLDYETIAFEFCNNFPEIENKKHIYKSIDHLMKKRLIVKDPQNKKYCSVNFFGPMERLE